ncbi:MAG: phosphoenolpyruvate--protein phosphotransferase [Chloroflexota bacterium]
MKELEVTIHNPTGLHARPAKVFVNLAKTFKSDIRVHTDKKKVNAKSMISMLTLGVKKGEQIRIVVKGKDEEEALTALANAVAEGLGEGEHIAAEKAKAATPAPKPQAPTKALPANQLQGVAAAPGIAIGPIFQFKQAEIEIDTAFAGAEAEQGRLQTAVSQARQQLQALREQMLTREAKEEAAIFDVHLEIMEDPELVENVTAKIEQQQNAAQAWQATISERAKMVASLADELLAARAADLRDVGQRVLRLLMGIEEDGHQLPDHPVILVADDLAPSDTAALDKERVLGFCTAVGGPTAHSAIIARALSLPAVVSAGEKVLDLANGTMAIVDGQSGVITLSPDETAVSQAKADQAQWQAQRAAAAANAAQPAVTQDGHRIEIVANIGGLTDAQEAMTKGAEGVGLLRTEFLFLERTEAPTEEEQFAVYRDIAQAMQDQPVIIRTLDIGGDKPLPYIDVPPETNPFLGERGIRLCLNRPELLRQQLRAILRAASFGKLLIMFPMVADLLEFRAARAMVEEVRAELEAPHVPVGIMIEVPSAALVADAFAPEIDFFSVGTNDLTQYTMAMDRQHPALAGKSDGLHPAVLRLIAKTVEAASAQGKWVGVCGELGSDPQAVPILVGLGVTELSVSVPAIPTVKAQVRSLSLAAAQDLAARALKCATAAEVRGLHSNQ